MGTNGIAILKGRNAVIFRPSSRAKKASGLAVEYMRQGLRQVGAPEDLVQCFDDADIPTTNELMGKADLVVATGGGPMVRAAYSSGTPSYCVARQTHLHHRRDADASTPGQDHVLQHLRLRHSCLLGELGHRAREPLAPGG